MVRGLFTALTPIQYLTDFHIVAAAAGPCTYLPIGQIPSYLILILFVLQKCYPAVGDLHCFYDLFLKVFICKLDNVHIFKRVIFILNG
jgi:hypothetical protein